MWLRSPRGGLSHLISTKIIKSKVLLLIKLCVGVLYNYLLLLHDNIVWEIKVISLTVDSGGGREDSFL